MNEISNNKVYFLMMLVLVTLTGLLNISPKLVVCSAIYVSLTLTANLISEAFGKKKALLGLILCISANLIVAFKSVDLMLICSFFSVFASVYYGVNLSANLKPKFNFPMRNLITLLACSVIDSIIMTCTLVTKFSITKSLSIGFGDLVLKFSYSITASLLVLAIFYLLKQDSKLKQI